MATSAAEMIAGTMRKIGVLAQGSMAWIDPGTGVTETKYRSSVAVLARGRGMFWMESQPARQVIATTANLSENRLRFLGEILSV